MMESGGTLGVPTAGKVETVGEKKHPNQDAAKKQKKKEKEEKKPLLAGHDEVVLSGEPEPHAQVSPKNTAQEHDGNPDDKGVFVDVKI